jgi:pimeloyl-ACP methyl ester carboxylesterase
MNFTVENQPTFAYSGSKPLDGARPGIIFIHGAANDHCVWQLQSRYFAHHGFNALAIDLPGHGRSGGDPLGSIGEYAGWLAAFLDAAGMSGATLVGHSMGALIAVETALRFPARVRQLALLGVCIPMPVAGVLLNAAKADPSSAFDMINLWGHGPAAKMGKSPLPGLTLLGNSRRLLEQSRPGVLYSDLRACNGYSFEPAQHQTIACPTLFLIGVHDQMTPPKPARATAALIAGAKTVAIDAGHSMMAEAPDDVLAHLRSFISSGR